MTDTMIEDMPPAPVPPPDLTAQGGSKPRRPRGTWRLIGRYALLSVFAVVVLFPIYITVVNSLLKQDQITGAGNLFPSSPQFHTYPDAWRDGHLGLYLKNSFIVTIIVVIGQLITATLAAYAFAFLRFPFKRTLFLLFLATLMIPFEITIITNLNTVVDLGLYDTYAGLAIPFLATGFGAFLLRQAFLAVPRDLQDASQLDGYGHWRFMTRVVVPLSRPTLAALAVFSFLSAWNQYLWPILVTKDDRLRTVQIGLKQLRNTNLENLNVLFAGVVIAVIPLAVLLLLFQKHLVRGLTAGAVKG